ncbi:MAG: hypothetical protein Q4C38_02610 [bacterium]|nr:hypothetical protein [bacterium]
MVNEYAKNIEAYKEVLQALPKNNDKNRKIYKNKIKDLLLEYQNDFSLVKEEIKKRNKSYLAVSPSEEIDLLREEKDKIKKKFPYTDKYNSAYEKSGLDVKLYQLGHYYTIDLDEVNNTIIKIIGIFREMGIELTDNDFNYSYYTKKYLSKLLSINEDNGYQEKMKQLFEEIYWKCPDIINHITLNFKYLYYLNEKIFNSYYDSKRMELEKENIYDNYINLCISLDNKIRDSKYIILNKFIRGEFNINDYTDEMINKLLGQVVETDNYKKEDLLDLNNTLNEYRLYMMVDYLVKDMKSLYDEKAKYKGIFNKKRKEIMKLEKALFKENKRIVKDNFKKFDYYNNKINDNIKILKDYYEELERDYFLEQVAKLNDDSTIYDLLSLANSNYNYLVELIKKNNLNIKEELNRINSLVNYPYINIINNIWIKDEKKIDLIIVDKYNLYGFKLNREMLSKDNIEVVIKNISIIINGLLLHKHNLDEKKIRFIKESIEIIND